MKSFWVDESSLSMTLKTFLVVSHKTVASTSLSNWLLFILLFLKLFQISNQKCFQLLDRRWGLSNCVDVNRNIFYSRCLWELPSKMKLSFFLLNSVHQWIGRTKRILNMNSQLIILKLKCNAFLSISANLYD